MEVFLPRSHQALAHQANLPQNPLLHRPADRRVSRVANRATSPVANQVVVHRDNRAVSQLLSLQASLLEFHRVSLLVNLHDDPRLSLLQIQVRSLPIIRRVNQRVDQRGSRLVSQAGNLAANHPCVPPCSPRPNHRLNPLTNLRHSPLPSQSLFQLHFLLYNLRPNPLANHLLSLVAFLQVSLQAGLRRSPLLHRADNRRASRVANRATSRVANQVVVHLDNRAVSQLLSLQVDQALNPVIVQADSQAELLLRNPRASRQVVRAVSHLQIL